MMCCTSPWEGLACGRFCERSWLLRARQELEAAAAEAEAARAAAAAAAAAGEEAESGLQARLRDALADAARLQVRIGPPV